MRPIALAAVCAAVALPLVGCAVPPALTVASLVADGVAVVTSGKTISDHAISNLAGEDCQMSRVLKGEWICHAETKVVTVAELPPAPPEPPLTVLSPYPRPSDPIAAEAQSAPVHVAAVTAPVAAPAKSAPPAVAAVPPTEPANPTTAPASHTPAPAMAQVKSEAAPKQAVAPSTSPVRPPANAKSASHAAPAQQAAAPANPAPRALSGPPVHGEMVIQGGTDAAEAQAIAGQLKGYSAKVRPVQQGGVTVYEIVVGISG